MQGRISRGTWSRVVRSGTQCIQHRLVRTHSRWRGHGRASRVAVSPETPRVLSECARDDLSPWPLPLELSPPNPRKKRQPKPRPNPHMAPTIRIFLNRLLNCFEALSKSSRGLENSAGAVKCAAIASCGITTKATSTYRGATGRDTAQILQAPG